MARTGVSRSASKVEKPLRFARTCYDHLAGQVAVGMAHAMVARGVLRPRGNEYQVLSPGARLFDELGIDLSTLGRNRRKLTRQCLDWTEREPHLGGALGAALLTRCISARWVTPLSRTRAVRITDRGSRALQELMDSTSRRFVKVREKSLRRHSEPNWWTRSLPVGTASRTGSRNWRRCGGRRERLQITRASLNARSMWVRAPGAHTFTELPPARATLRSSLTSGAPAVPRSPACRSPR